MPRLSFIKVLEGLSETKAWLLGFLAGDGAFDLSVSYRVTAHVGDDELVPAVQSAFQHLYEGVRTRHKTKQLKSLYHYVRCDQKMVVQDLLSYGPFGLKTWRVPKAIESAPTNIKCAWIRGFFDADGYGSHSVDHHTRIVEADSVNLPGMVLVGELMDSLGIGFHRYWRPPRNEGDDFSYQIRVSYHEDLQKYFDMVGFASDRKRETIRHALETLTRFPERRSVVADLTPSILAMREEGHTFASIASVHEMLKSTVQAVCKRHGVEPKPGSGRGRTNRKRGERKVLYVEIARRIEEGKTRNEIAEELKLSGRKEVDDIVKYYAPR